MRMTTADVVVAAPDPGMTRLIDSLDDVLDRLEHEPQRFTVARTRHTEQRALIARSTRETVYCRDGWRCVWCGSADRLQLDHITPWSHGGDDGIDNLRTLCGACNEFRSNYGQLLDLTVRPTPHGWICTQCRPALGEFVERFSLPVSVVFCGWCHETALGLACGIGPTEAQYRADAEAYS